MFVGIIFGMLPGLGGVAAVSILLPFIYMLDDYSALAMLLGAVSVVYTSDTITSVLIGAPGSPASAPTAIEGFAMAKRGEAARALGVGFLASMVGGLVGAIVLFVAIPVAGPVVLMLGTPELLMFALVGLYFASSMVGKDLAKGLGAACLGILLGVVGPASAAADFRFTFGQVYLLDGFSLTIVALGLFGLAEVVSMLATGGGISGEKFVVTRWGDGFRDFWTHRWLVLRGAIIGVFGGFVPAVGASASTWVAYGHAIRSAKDKSQFGKGDIRGIAAAEGANNATVISDLVPTLLFSVPGGPAAAIFLGALFTFGYYPGPRMVTEHPDLMFLIVWSVALTSVVGAGVCFAISPMMAKLTRIPFAIIAAPLVLIMTLGAYQATGTMGDIFLLFLLGAVGWMMKHADWPRAPALVGFVLSGPMEQYFWLANQLHGWSWLLRPGVVIIASFIAVPLVLQLVRYLRQRGKPDDGMGLPDAEDTGYGRIISAVLAALITAVFAYALWEMMGFNPTSRLMPGLAILPGLPLSAWLLFRAVRGLGGATMEGFTEHRFLWWMLAYPLALWAIGWVVPTVLLLVWMLIVCARMRRGSALVYGAVVYGAIALLFYLMRGTPPVGHLFNLI
ncbi:MAG: tripartite tricarboxylate transporter permease, partial [Paracoccaceae bacterium]|nr:tripartite tricarboxylate transporter permease [Paracoccaceae bacterium]